MKIDRMKLCREISQQEVETFLKKNPELKEQWLASKGKITQRRYVRDLIRYLETLSQNKIASTPKELYDLTEGNEGYGAKHKEITTLEDFQGSAEKLFPENQRSLIYGLSITVKSFYSSFGKQFPKDRGNYFLLLKKTKRVPEISEIMPYMNGIKRLRDRMLVALLSSGCPLRLETLTFLKWSHFKELLENPNMELPHILIQPQLMKGKSKGKYQHIIQIGFISPFAKQYILEWKAEYERITKKTIDIKNPSSLEEPFLIAYIGETKGEALKYGALNVAFDGYKTKEYSFTVHIWRTFCNEGMKKSRMLKEDRDLILGHSMGKVEYAYSQTDVERLRQEFKRVIRYVDCTFKADKREEDFKRFMKEKYNIEPTDEDAKEFVDKGYMSLLSKLEHGS